MRDSGKQIEMNLGSFVPCRKMHENSLAVAQVGKLCEACGFVMSCHVLLSCSRTGPSFHYCNIILWGLGGGIFHRALSQHVVTTFGSDPTVPRGTKSWVYAEIVRVVRFGWVWKEHEGAPGTSLGRSFAVRTFRICFFVFNDPWKVFLFPEKTCPIDSSPWT